jgi:siroheme synthase-like protein
MSYYPIWVEMTGRRCVVIGGGVVGERKVEGLLQSGAEVTLIGPDLTERLEAWAKEGAIRHVSRPYRRGDLIGCEVAFAATDDPELNATIHKDAREQKIWLNAADDPAHCDFILPAVHRRGHLTMAVSTGGGSPAAARAIRDELGKYLTDDFGQLVEIASEVRRELRERSLRPSAESWNAALQGDFRRLIREGKAEEAKRLLLEKLGAIS